MQIVPDILETCNNFLWTVCASVGSANNMNKLSLVGMQLPEKYKKNFDVSSEGPSSGVTCQVTSWLVTPDEGPSVV
jgi:ribulose 1,5-bisphosphate carboxylase large subunit-like protein